VIGVAQNCKQYDWAADPQPVALQNREFLGEGKLGPHMPYLTLVMRASCGRATRPPSSPTVPFGGVGGDRYAGAQGHQDGADGSPAA
jgi:hypothetical protein